MFEDYETNASMTKAAATMLAVVVEDIRRAICQDFSTSYERRRIVPKSAKMIVLPNWAWFVAALL